jgi:phosphoadenosine phosphosulfate reductase
MLIENTIMGIHDKVMDAIEEIKAHEPPEGYYVADSGGKDSSVVLDLVKRSGVKYQAYFHLTTVDPPELIRFLKKYHPETIITRPKTTMWKLMVKKRMPPTRIVRYCCQEFKEGYGNGRIVVLGVRRKESYGRSKRKMIEACNKPSKNKILFRPIIDWSDYEVWEYIRKYNIPYCLLYDEGYKRIGCIMCPMVGKKNMRRHAARWPKYYNNYLRAFNRILDNNIESGRNGEYDRLFRDADEMMDWWISGEASKKNPNQMEIPFDFE